MASTHVQGHSGQPRPQRVKHRARPPPPGPLQARSPFSAAGVVTGRGWRARCLSETREKTRRPVGNRGQAPRARPEQALYPRQKRRASRENSGPRPCRAPRGRTAFPGEATRATVAHSGTRVTVRPWPRAGLAYRRDDSGLRPPRATPETGAVGPAGPSLRPPGFMVPGLPLPCRARDRSPAPGEAHLQCERAQVCKQGPCRTLGHLWAHKPP